MPLFQVGNLEHVGVKGMRWGVRKSRKDTYKTYMEKERAYEKLDLSEGQRLPKNWRKQMAKLDKQKLSDTDKKAISKAKKIVGAGLAVWGTKQLVDLARYKAGYI